MQLRSIALVITILAAQPAAADDVLITNLDRYSGATPTFQRFSATQWLTVGFTTDDSAYEVESIEPLVRLTTVSASLLGELRSGTLADGPDALVGTFGLVPGFSNVMLPDAPVALSPNTTYHFSLGYPLGNATISDWFNSEIDFTSDGPATMEQGWVSSDQGASWATGGFLKTSRFLFEVRTVPEPGSAAGIGAALLSILLVRVRHARGRRLNARRRQRPWKRGGRFSRKACTPSR